MLSSIKSFICVFGLLTLCACSVAKLEARLEANPQCKDVINPKTGSVMPCPGTDKSFYRSVGLEPQRPSSSAIAAAAATTIANTSSTSDSASKATAPATTSAPRVATPASSSDCKPQIHKKTGGMLPCPVPD
ncbi:hypothetical protein [Polynucleobacter sp. AP-Kolm-20A-A1]|uniref:hypothetical protein n=1 Tax=Polynucleobacter sp. AP-Kolm-20A-A1 TaxID=2081041 RepID=UPI001BFE8BBC|nr:hypothetical protein [Polynucleobacter sp. AP-Kolm-20A-A1]QWE19802.1 hypothetical protein C2745_05110 [Polynucleobacter sp. AP-Kolm-20A-A1]